ncbi:response regulator [Hymenobacter tenuis]
MKTFLIDDDNLGNYLTEAILRMEGFASSIRTFESAADALAELEKPGSIPDVIFLDLNMPIMSGWQFLDALLPQSSALRGRCHIYVLTSSLAPDDMQKALTYELVTGLIHKPIDRWEIQTIQEQLSSKR